MGTARYAIGDVVRVRELADLQAEFGQEIDVPCSWTEQMDKFCGNEYTISDIYYIDGSPYYYFSGDIELWCFDECVLEDDVSEKIMLDISIADMLNNPST